ncbi:MAG: hypothetical protein AMJ84_10070 [Acidithiobacillales bacterium SM23_46]|nr:MAG: hypothetical protein AMJ84_10070 [Acidithiobacillales bacterium SM23_46]
MDQPFRVVVIGGGAGGPRVAADGVRLQPSAEVTLVEKGTTLSVEGHDGHSCLSVVVPEQEETAAVVLDALSDSALSHDVKTVTA